MWETYNYRHTPCILYHNLKLKVHLRGVLYNTQHFWIYLKCKTSIDFLDFTTFRCHVVQIFCQQYEKIWRTKRVLSRLHGLSMIYWSLGHSDVIFISPFFCLHCAFYVTSVSTAYILFFYLYLHRLDSDTLVISYALVWQWLRWDMPFSFIGYSSAYMYDSSGSTVLSVFNRNCPSIDAIMGSTTGTLKPSALHIKPIMCHWYKTPKSLMTF